MIQSNGLIGSAILSVIAVAILLVPVHEVQEVETYDAREPLTYERTFLRESQVTRFCFPWFCDKAQVIYGLKNTDDVPGEFRINFIFDNRIERDTTTKSITIIAGEERAISVDSPIGGKSDFTVNVIPPRKIVTHERLVTKKINTLSKLNTLRGLWLPK